MCESVIHYNFDICLSFQLQQMEEAQLQQREANLTALAAIGPRRKRPLEQTDSQVGVCAVSLLCSKKERNTCSYQEGNVSLSVVFSVFLYCLNG